MKKQKLSSSSCRLSSLPDEMVLNILARVSRLDHASVSLVSKWLRSQLLPLDNLYNVRSLMGSTENCIYVCLRIPPGSRTRWFTLFPKTRHGRRLVPVKSPFYKPPDLSSVVALGYGMYVMGGKINGRLSSRVFFLDCRTHTWSSLPSMGVARASATAGVVDGKIYVLGGCEDPESSRWGEVFDPKTRSWDALPMPLDDDSLRIQVMNESGVMDNKVFGLNRLGISLSYMPSEGVWKIGNREDYAARKGWYVIENVMYCCVKDGRIMWCEPEELERHEPKGMEWREVMGLADFKEKLCASRVVEYGDGLQDYMGLSRSQVYNFLPGYKLSNSGSNMLLFWDVLDHWKKLEIWCAEISLERCKKRGETWGNIKWIRGSIKWSKPVKTFDARRSVKHQHCKILHSLSLNL